MTYRDKIPHVVALALLVASTIAIAQQTDENTAASGGGDSDTATVKSEEDEKSARKGKFLVVPIVITEPAIGEGLGAAVVYFHGGGNSAKPRVVNGKTIARSARNSTPPPTVTGVMGFYTNNDTNGAGIMHSNSLKDDRYRLTGILADFTVNSRIFLLDIPFDFQLDGNLGFASVKRRTGDSNLFLGMSFMALDADTQFFFSPAEVPPVPLLDFGLTNVGVAVSLTYDRRDNSTMPENGQLIDLSVWRYDDVIGSDFEYTSARLKALSFHELHEKFVLGLRLYASTVSGDPPFFAVPYVSLRGIPALRYQGDTAGTVEIEGRYQFADRWSGLVFAGAGFTDVRKSELETSQDMNAYGAGIRFKALKEQNVWLGLDVARGPEETAWYFQVGQGW